MAAAAIIAGLAGCGSRGNPLPPVYPNPPAVTGLTVAQRGSFAILRFPPPELRVTVGEEIELQEVEVLVYAERYPVLTAEMLIAAAQRRADIMRADAAADASAAAARAAQQAAAEQAAAEGREPPPPDPDAPATTVGRRTPDADAISRVPPDILEDWRREGLAADAVLASAYTLMNAVDPLWRDLGLPATVIDPAQPLPLPDAGTIAAASRTLLQRAGYERPLPVDAFLGRAAVSRSMAVDQFEELTVGTMLQAAIPVGTPSTGGLRTRYFFAVRGRSTRNTPGLVSAVVPLAPAPVPVAPAGLAGEVVADGITISWQPPAGDLALQRLDPERLRYNVYRLQPDGIAGSDPVNPQPLAEPSFTDTSLQWGQTYVYEVRALLAGAGDAAAPGGAGGGAGGAGVRESEGTRTAAIAAIDVYPPAPPSEVTATRAGGRVTLQWTPSPSLDIVGYRVYRHRFPAPEVPLRFNPAAPEGDPAAAAPPASGPPPGATMEGGPANPMLTAGWELVTPEPAPFSRVTDPDAAAGPRFVYAIEAIDAAGNLSALAVGTEPGEFRH